MVEMGRKGEKAGNRGDTTQTTMTPNNDNGTPWQRNTEPRKKQRNKPSEMHNKVK
jgi:hypothetical protein